MDKPEKRPLYLAHISEDQTRTQSVRDHLEGVAKLAGAFARPFGGEEQGFLAGMLHDIGKYSLAFQKRLEGGPKVDHATAGAKEAFLLRQAEAAFAIVGHHGGLPDGGGKNDSLDSGTLLGRMKKQLPPYEAWRQEVQLPAAPGGKKPPRDNFTESFYIRMLYSCLVDADYLDTEAFMDGAAPFRFCWSGCISIFRPGGTPGQR